MTAHVVAREVVGGFNQNDEKSCTKKLSLQTRLLTISRAFVASFANRQRYKVLVGLQSSLIARGIQRGVSRNDGACNRKCM